MRAAWPLPARSQAMMDFVYVVLTAGLFALSWGLVRLCDRV
jgi:hypothetical protein